VAYLGFQLWLGTGNEQTEHILLPAQAILSFLISISNTIPSCNTCCKLLLSSRINTLRWCVANDWYQRQAILGLAPWISLPSSFSLMRSEGSSTRPMLDSTDDSPGCSSPHVETICPPATMTVAPSPLQSSPRLLEPTWSLTTGPTSLTMAMTPTSNATRSPSSSPIGMACSSSLRKFERSVTLISPPVFPTRPCPVHR
jgi:hypothetical protein